MVKIKHTFGCKGVRLILGLDLLYSAYSGLPNATAFSFKSCCDWIAVLMLRFSVAGVYRGLAFNTLDGAFAGNVE